MFYSSVPVVAEGGLVYNTFSSAHLRVPRRRNVISRPAFRRPVLESPD